MRARPAGKRGASRMPRPTGGAPPRGPGGHMGPPLHTKTETSLVGARSARPPFRHRETAPGGGKPPPYGGCGFRSVGRDDPARPSVVGADIIRPRADTQVGPYGKTEKMRRGAPMCAPVPRGNAARQGCRALRWCDHPGPYPSPARGRPHGAAPTHENENVPRRGDPCGRPPFRRRETYPGGGKPPPYRRRPRPTGAAPRRTRHPPPPYNI